VQGSYGTSSNAEFAIPPPLILEKGDDAAVVDWFKVDATASGDPLGFDDAAQAAFKHVLASTLNNAVPVEHMVFLMEDSGSSISVSCAFPASLESSEAVAAALNNVDFVDTFTASVYAYSAEDNLEVDIVSISDVTSSKVLENAEVTSFHSIFGVSGPGADASLALSAVAQKPTQPASSTTAGRFDRSALAALSTAGIVCVGLFAVVAMQARSAFVSKIPQPGASAAGESRGSLTPKSDML